MPYTAAIVYETTHRRELAAHDFFEAPADRHEAARLARDAARESLLGPGDRVDLIEVDGEPVVGWCLVCERPHFNGDDHVHLGEEGEIACTKCVPDDAGF